MQTQDPIEIGHRLIGLRQQHRDLDAAIQHLAEAIGRDELQLTRLKKRKLLLKDHIQMIVDSNVPDIIA